MLKHSPTPQQRRHAKSQARTAQWRASQQFKERSDLAWQTLKDSHTLTRKKRQSTINWHMKRLQPSTDELMARTTQNWDLLKRGSRKKAINKSAEEYVAETARQKSQMDRLIADWTKDGHGHIDFKRPKE